jgi:hypothetical protein
MPEEPKKKFSHVHIARAANGFTLHAHQNDGFSPIATHSQEPELYVFKSAQDLIIKLRELLDQ